MLHIIFDGPPGPVAGRFIEVNNDEGVSVNAGEWRPRNDGTWELMIPTDPMPRRYCTRGGVVYCAHGSSSISLAEALLGEIAALEAILEEERRERARENGPFGAGA